MLALSLCVGGPHLVTLAAQARQLTLDDIYPADTTIDPFSGRPPSGLTWASDAVYVWPRPGTGDGVDWLKVDAATGTSEPLFDAERMRAAFDALPGIGPDDVSSLPNRRSLTMDEERTAVVVSIAGDLYYYRFGAERGVRLTFDGDPEEEAAFSPDGRLVSFVRHNDLFVVAVEGQTRERQLTSDGGDKILNGKLDWVYQEEIYGRGNYRGYWWSPDSTSLAFLQLDEASVPEFTVVDHVPNQPGVELQRYPKAGDPNPGVSLGIVSAAGGPVRWVDLDKYAPEPLLVVNVSWTPDSRHVAYQVQDREQTWLDLNLAAAAGLDTKTLLRETTTAWVNANGPASWLKDGSFLWLSERTGWKHVYHYAASGALIRPVTTGDWDVRALHGVDEGSGWIYFSGTERSYTGLDVYRTRLDGTGLARLSDRTGTHRATFSPGFQRFIDTWSNLTTPPQVRVLEASGRELRLVHAGEVPALMRFALSTPERMQVKTRDGFTMEAVLIKPPDFNPSRKYPVMQFTYAGPGSPSTNDAWGGRTHMYYQLLAQRGIIVWLCDNRSASGKGAQSAWPIYKNFGELELRDIEDGLNALRKQPWVDASRIGIDGWSFGGFMTTYALTHSTSFAMGIAGGSVTDWRLYDSIYTERYMLMPQRNPAGYDRSSVVKAAKDLHGSLLLLHGVIDDNVHLQQTMAFGYALQKAGKAFRLMLYEKSRHAVTDPALMRHLRQTMLDFTIETLLEPHRQQPTNQK